MPAPCNRRTASLARVAGVALIALAACAPAAADNASFAESARSAVTGVAGKVRDGAQELAVYALGLLGVRYRFGGESPDSGLDCSGLVRHVFQQVTGVTLPRTAKEMSRVGDGVGRHELEPGDLVFFNTRRRAGGRSRSPTSATATGSANSTARGGSPAPCPAWCRR